MTEVFTTAVYGEGWCEHCSKPPASYIYHLGTPCPELSKHADEHQDMADAVIHSLQYIPHIDLNLPQPPPQQNDKPIVWDLVIEDMRERDKKGVQKYHTHLQPFNGRDALIDAYQEALDLVVYLRQLIYEKEKRDFLIGHP